MGYVLMTAFASFSVFIFNTYDIYERNMFTKETYLTSFKEQEIYESSSSEVFLKI